MSDATPSYGLRFFNELRRLTSSTCGVSYSDISRLQAMGQNEVVGFVGGQMRLTWAAGLDGASPEQLAHAIVQGIQERERQRRDTVLAVELLGALLAPVLPD